MSDDVMRAEAVERERPIIHEVIDDELEIEYYKAKTMAGSGFIVDPDFAQRYLKMGKLPVFLMAFRVKDWTPKVNPNGEGYKEVRLEAWEVRELDGEVRREAMAYFAATSPEVAHEGDTATLALPMSAEGHKLQQAGLQQELLEQYLGQRWGFVPNDDETPVEAAMRLLEELKDINDSAPPALDVVRDVSDEEWEFEEAKRSGLHGELSPKTQALVDGILEGLEDIDPAAADVLAELEDDDEDDEPAVVRDAGPSFEDPGVAPRADRSSGPIFDEPSDEPAAAR